MRVRLSMLALSAALFGLCAYAAQKTTTLEGTLVDANCYLKSNTNTGNDHMGVKGCGTTCLKSGLPAAVLTKSGQFHIIVARSVALAPYVGQEVRVSGTLAHGDIEAQKVGVQQNGKWQEVNINSMM